MPGARGDSKMAQDPRDRIGPFQANKTFTDASDKFEGGFITDPMEVLKTDSKIFR